MLHVRFIQFDCLSPKAYCHPIATIATSTASVSAIVIRTITYTTIVTDARPHFPLQQKQMHFPNHPSVIITMKNAP